MHIPVFLNQIIDNLEVKENQKYIDCTLGEGGHALEILKQGGILLGLDLDKRSIEFCKKKFEENNISKEKYILKQANFKDIKKIALKNDFNQVQGIIVDLGINTYLLEQSQRGFTFKKDEPLDMRYGNTEAQAKDFLNELREKDLADMIFLYGEEPLSRHIAKEIVKHRKKEKIQTTFQLREIINQVVFGPNKRKEKAITRVFQALRIKTNYELENLETLLNDSLELLSINGVLAIISFHSLEDRIVKTKFKNLSQDYEVLTKKPIKCDKQEFDRNKKSRSAKLRIIKKTS
jgi:16S rRNA (cytosine1402-N4)-methyltransferase